MVRPIKGSHGHHHWLEGYINPLTEADCVDYVTIIIKRIFKFL